MPKFRVAEAAALLGVSDDTARRYIEFGQLPVSLDSSNRKVVDGKDLAAFNRGRGGAATDTTGTRSSTPNRLVGLVTTVSSDEVMAQVEMQCGRSRVVSLMSAEAARDLKMEPGALAVAVVNAADVILELPPKGSRYRGTDL